jgi:hypothetical protein
MDIVDFQRFALALAPKSAAVDIYFDHVENNEKS